MKKWTRSEMLKNCARSGVLMGIVGACVALNSREEKFDCNSRCGRCSKNVDGICGLGLK